MEWQEKTIIKELVKEFGEAFREDIESSLDLKDGYADLGNAGVVEIDGRRYHIIQNEEEAEKIAVKIVKEQLQDSPELFNFDWLSSYIYISSTDIDLIVADEEDRIRDEVEEDAEKEFEDKELELFEREEKAEAEKNESELEEIEKDKILLEKEKEEWIETQVEDKLDKLKSEIEKNPVEYLRSSFGYSADEFLKLPFVRIDYDSAADDAVATDGWVHFLNHYDDRYDITDNGLVYFGGKYESN